MRNKITVLTVVTALLASGLVAVAVAPGAAAETAENHDGEPEFTVTDVDAPISAVVGETVTMNVTVTNTDAAGTDSVEVGLSKGGESENLVNETREVQLDANESTTISLTLSTDGLEQGAYYGYASTPDDSQGTTVNLVDTDEINATAVCVDHEDDTATFKVTNGNDREVFVTYQVRGRDDGGSIHFFGSEEQFVTVPTDEDGTVNVTFYYSGTDEHDFETNETLETVASNPDQRCGPREQQWDEENITLTADCYDPVDNQAWYTLANANDEAIPFQVAGSFSRFDVTVAANSTASFTVGTTDRGDGLARLYWTGGVENATRLVAAESATTDLRCDLGAANEGDADQFDLDTGEVIRDLGADQDAFYNSDGSLLQARNFHEGGNATHSYNTPDSDKTAHAAVADGTPRYDAISFDGASGEATVDVSLSTDADEPVQLTFAAYELPDGTIEYQRDRADEQELRDYVTVTVAPGKSRTFTVDTDD